MRPAKRAFLVLYPLFFLAIGFSIFLYADNQFRTHMKSDIAQTTEQLSRSGMSRDQVFYLTVMLQKIESNTASYQSSVGVFAVFLPVMMMIPVTSKLFAEEKSKRAADRAGNSPGVNLVKKD